MTPSADLPPIRDLLPLEAGGCIARQGFSYQDHIAIGLLLDLLQSPELAEVWCETIDDITLIGFHDGQEQVEFVQVKSSEFDQLWSIALLCRPDGPSGRSIVEKSLANDRCSEPCAFRIVTRWHVKEELAILKLPLVHARRLQQEKAALVQALVQKLGDVTSQKGNGLEYWVEHTLWEVRGEQEAVINGNLLRLNQMAHDHGALLAPDQLREAYERLLRLVRNAAEAEPANLTKKRISRHTLRGELVAALEAHALGSASRRGLADKLQDAGFPASTIESATDLRMRYRREVLTPRYFTTEDRERFEAEVQGVLHRLQAELDARVIPDTSEQFLVRCLGALDRLREEWGGLRPSQAMLQGMMYDLAHRCLHRFHRAAA